MGLWIAVAAVNGFLAVAMGAFAAHGLQAHTLVTLLTHCLLCRP